MAKLLTCSEVLGIIDDSDWENSDDDCLESDEEDNVYHVDPLDRVQDDDGPNDCVDTYDPLEPSSPDHTSDDSASPSISPTASPSPPTNAAVPFNPPPFTSPVGPLTVLNSTATPLDFFMLLFDDDILQLLVDQTNLYASQNPPGARYKWYDTSCSELKLFLGVIIAMGIHRLPQLEDYWSSDVLLGVPGIVDGMPIDRFKVLQRCLHANDNATLKPRDDPEYDRLHKLRPLLTAARANFLREYRPHREVSVDEAMVGFKGRSSLKQYMPLKPTKRGYKIWCLCDSHNGYMCNFEVYTGASGPRATDAGGLGPSVVKRLTEPMMDLGHFVFYDNFFATVDLAKDLLERNTYSCATARSNRRKFPDSLKRPKLKRGENVSELVEGSEIQCFVWQDKKVVSFINTVYDPTEQSQVKRKNKDGSQALIPCPVAVKQYNMYMGGVDMADAKRKVYSCSRRSKKWWHRLFYFIVDVCIVNAHILQSETSHQGKMQQKKFRLELAREMLASHSSRKHRKRGRCSMDGAPSALYNEQHFPEKLSTPQRCRFCSAAGERRRSSFGCKECNPEQPIPLCIIPCFRLYHTQ